MDFGYARVSSEEQSLNLQIDALIDQGISEKNIYLDKVSGARAEREKLNELLDKLREGDTLYVWKMDRMARSLIHFTKLANHLKEEGVFFKSLTEPFLDTTGNSPHGNFLINIFASLAEFEKDLIKERTKAGLSAAKKRGAILGPPKGMSERAKQKSIVAKRYHDEGMLKVQAILDKLDISRGTYYKYLQYQGVTITKYKPRKK